MNSDKLKNRVDHRVFNRKLCRRMQSLGCRKESEHELECVVDISGPESNHWVKVYQPCSPSRESFQ